MPAISHVLLNNIFNPSFPTKKWKKLSFLFFSGKNANSSEIIFAGAKAAQNWWWSLAFFCHKAVNFISEETFFYVSSHCCPMAMWSSSLSVASQFTSLSISHNTSKYAKSKCNKRSMVTFFGQKISNFGDFWTVATAVQGAENASLRSNAVAAKASEFSECLELLPFRFHPRVT